MNKYLPPLLLLLLISQAFSFVRAPRTRQNDILSIATSDDGSVIVWDWFYDICIADAKNLPNYNRYSLKGTCEFGACATKISGNGKTVCFIDDSTLYVSDIKNYTIKKLDKIELKEFGQPRYLAIDFEGNRILVSIMGKSIPNKCAPGWENALLFTRGTFGWQHSPFIRKTDDCEYVRDFRFISGNSIIYNYQSIKNNSNLLVKTAMDNKRHWCCEHMLNVPAGTFLDVNRAGTMFIMSYKKVMNTGDSVPSIFQSHITDDSTLSEPQPLLNEHKDPILWGIRLSPQGNKLAWHHLIRGEDGETIVKQEIRMIEYKEKKWSEPETIYDMSIHSTNAGFVFNNNNLVIIDYSDDNLPDAKFPLKNSLFFYSALNKNGTLTEITQKKEKTD
jgi:hypothetical protein